MVELITSASFSPSTQKLFAEESCAEQAANSDTVALLRSAKFAYNRLSEIITNTENVKIASSVMVGCNECCDEESFRAFEEFTNKLSQETRGDTYYISYGRAFHETMINRLINGEINDPKLNTCRVQILYDGFEDYIYVAVVDMSQSGISEDAGRIFLRSVARHNNMLFKFARRENYIVMLMSSKCKYLSDAGLFDNMYKLIDRYNLFVGISDSFDNLYELRQYYDQALEALQAGMLKGGKERIFLTENEN